MSVKISSVSYPVEKVAFDAKILKYSFKVADLF